MGSVNKFCCTSLEAGTKGLGILSIILGCIGTLLGIGIFVIKDNEEMIKTLQLKIVNEQEINDQAEEEIIQLRIELDNLKKEISDNKTEQEQNVGLLEEQKETEKLKDLNLQVN